MAKNKSQRAFSRCVKRLGGGKVARGKCLYRVYIKKSGRKAKKSPGLSGCGCGA